MEVLNFNINIPEDVLTILNTLQKNNYEALGIKTLIGSRNTPILLISPA